MVCRQNADYLQVREYKQAEISQALRDNPELRHLLVNFS